MTFLDNICNLMFSVITLYGLDYSVVHKLLCNVHSLGIPFMSHVRVIVPFHVSYILLVLLSDGTISKAVFVFEFKGEAQLMVF